VQLHLAAQPSLEVGKPPKKFAKRRHLSQFLAQQEFVVHQLEGVGVLGRQGRVQEEIGFRGDALAAAPAAHLVSTQEVRDLGGREIRSPSQHRSKVRRLLRIG
jgi:hypothetical protein